MYWKENIILSVLAIQQELMTRVSLLLGHIMQAYRLNGVVTHILFIAEYESTLKIDPRFFIFTQSLKYVLKSGKV